MRAQSACGCRAKAPGLSPFSPCLVRTYDAPQHPLGTATAHVVSRVDCPQYGEEALVADDLPELRQRVRAVEIRVPVRRSHQHHRIMVSKGIVYGRLGAPQLEPHSLLAQVGHVGVVVGVVSDGVAFLHDPSQQAGSRIDPAPEHEECCLQIVLPQRVEDPRGGARIRAIVEGKGDTVPPGPGLAVDGQIGPGILAIAASRTRPMSGCLGSGGSGKIPASGNKARVYTLSEEP